MIADSTVQGVLVVDKPAGITSHDVVNRVRRLTRMRRVGHTGTLDPMATGVLVLLLGPATRLSRFILGENKRYHGVIRLGITTSTYDAEGEVTATRPVDLDLTTIYEALTGFMGEVLQVPPMHAAIRHQGKRLYQLAREGVIIEREPRAVTIHALKVLAWEMPDLTLDILCSSGTYIRSLAHDLGQVLGCGGHLTALRRIAVGHFDIQDSHTLNELEEMAGNDSFTTALLPAHAALGDMPIVRLTAEQEQAVRYGQAIDVKTPPDTESIQARDGADRLVAVLIPADGAYRPTIVLPPRP